MNFCSSSRAWRGGSQPGRSPRGGLWLSPAEVRGDDLGGRVAIIQEGRREDSVTESKLILLTTQQASKLRDEVLGPKNSDFI